MKSGKEIFRFPRSTFHFQLTNGIVSSLKTLRSQAARPISTAWLKALQPFHLRPINLVVYQGPSVPHPLLGAGGKPRLGGGLALRCIQRLSFPDTAIQRCSWRNNWDTGGPSPQVLSYCAELSSSFLRPPEIETELSHARHSVTRGVDYTFTLFRGAGV